MKSTFIRIFAFIILIVSGVSFSVFSQESEKTKLEISQIDTSIWKYLKAKDRSKWQISQDDSVIAYREYLVPGYRIYQRISALSNNKRITSEQRYEKMLPLLEQCQEYFEGGLQINPFSKRLRDFLRFVYKSLDGLYFYKKNDNKRFEVLLKRLIIEKDWKERYKINFSLGSIYSTHGQYQEAIAYLDTAVALIFEVDDFAEVDTITLANVLYLKGYSFYNLNDGERALQALTRARMIAPDQLKKNISSLIYAISWDDGNINSFRLQNEATKYFNEKKYEEAAKVYEQLLNIAKTERVRRYAHFRLGTLEFNQLNRPEDGLTRFWILKNILLALPDTGAAIDSTRNIFLKNYAQMCFTTAQKARKNDRRKAFFYFYELTSFENQHRPRSYYFLADLTRNNIDICLDYCKKAYQTWDEFAEFDKINLAAIFYSTYLNRGEFDEAIEWFKKYYELRHATKKQ